MLNVNVVKKEQEKWYSRNLKEGSRNKRRKRNEKS